MELRRGYFVALAGLAIAAIAMLVVVNRHERTTPTIVVGWQITVATEGQAVEALKSSDILANRKLNVAWVPFLIGPPMVQSALAGRLDVADMASQPTLALVAQSDDWVVVARGTSLRIAVVAPPELTFHTIADLKGKRIGVPIGSTNEVFLVNAITTAGLKRGDFDITNVGPPQNVEVIRAGTDQDWRGYAAVVVWEPQLSILESQHKVRVVEQAFIPFYITMRRSFVSQRPSDARSYLCAFREAWLYYAGHQDALNQLYVEDSRLKVDLQTLKSIAQSDRNLHARTLANVDIALSSSTDADLNTTLAYLHSRKQISPDFVLAKSVDKTVLPTAGECVQRAASN